MKRIGPIASAGAVSVLLLLAFLAAATTASAKATLEPIAVDHLQVPAGYSGESEPDWLPDGKHIVAAVSSPELATPQLAVTRLDGSHPRCVTCDLDSSVVPGAPAGAAFGKPVALPDGKRLMVRLGLRPGGGGSATQNFTYGIVECTPTLVNCEERTLSPIIMPGGGIDQGTQNREGRMSPDGRWFGWTEFTQNGTAMSIGRLTKNGDEYDLEDVKVLNPSGPLGTDSAAWRAQAPYFELKNFTADGKSVLYSSMYDADNFDTWRVDLRTGERTRITKGIDWEEDVSTSPDDGAYLQFSSRGFDRMPIFALMPRPPFIDFALFSWVGRYELNAVNRKCLLEPWLMNSRGERGTYFGQPVDPRPGTGWDNRTLGQWSPDGTKLLMWQARGDDDGTPERPGARMVIADLPARKAKRKNAGNATPTPKWAPDRSSYTGFLANSHVHGAGEEVRIGHRHHAGQRIRRQLERPVHGLLRRRRLVPQRNRVNQPGFDSQRNHLERRADTEREALGSSECGSRLRQGREQLRRPGLRHGQPAPRQAHGLDAPVTHLRAAREAPAPGQGVFAPEGQPRSCAGHREGPRRFGLRPVRHATVRVEAGERHHQSEGHRFDEGGAGRKVSAAAAGFTGAKARVPCPARR